MSLKESKLLFKEIADICYEEDFPELHREIVSLELVTKRQKNSYKYEKAIQELLIFIPIFAGEDFPSELFAQLERMYNNYMENK